MALRFSQLQAQLMLYERTRVARDKQRSLEIALELQHRVAALIYELQKESHRGPGSLPPLIA
jgi:hypothetical protein